MLGLIANKFCASSPISDRIGSRDLLDRVVRCAGQYLRYIQLYTQDIVCTEDTVSLITLSDH
jgi:hypothetical protein